MLQEAPLLSEFRTILRPIDEGTIIKNNDNFDISTDAVNILFCFDYIIALIHSEKLIQSKSKQIPMQVDSTPTSSRLNLLQVAKDLHIEQTSSSNLNIITYLIDNISTIFGTTKLIYSDQIMRTALLQRQSEIMKASKILFEDCFARKQLMKKRLEVTLQAFFWSQRGKEKESELRKIIDSAMNEISMLTKGEFGIEDLFLVDENVLFQQIVSSRKHRNGKPNAIEKFVMSSEIPDRGGRPLEPRCDGGGFARGQHLRSFSRGRAGRSGNERRQLVLSQEMERKRIKQDAAVQTYSSEAPSTSSSQQQQGGRQSGGRVKGNWNKGNQQNQPQGKHGNWGGINR